MRLVTSPLWLAIGFLLVMLIVLDGLTRLVVRLSVGKG
jgi:hypothetical protein